MITVGTGPAAEPAGRIVAGIQWWCSSYRNAVCVVCYETAVNESTVACSVVWCAESEGGKVLVAELVWQRCLEPRIQ